MPLIDAPSWGVFSLLTGPTALAVLAVIVGAWRRWWSLPAAVLAANLTSYVLKRLIGRERPPAEQWLVEASNYSLPSGHATGAAAFAMALTLIIGWRAWSLLAWVGGSGDRSLAPGVGCPLGGRRSHGLDSRGDCGDCHVVDFLKVNSR